MEQLISVEAIRAVRHGNLSLDRTNDMVCGLLTQDGPKFRLGEIKFEADLWEVVACGITNNALHLHWCGVWGAISEVDDKRNAESLATGQGRVVSYWQPAETVYPSFWIVTDILDGRPETLVFHPFDA